MPIYLPLQVDFADDENVAKIARYGRDARAIRDLLVQMWLYCKRNLTDGKVPVEQVGKLVYPDPPKVGIRDADRLVEVGMAQHVPEGYFLPGYLKRNKSRAQVEAERVKRAESGRIGGKRSGSVRRDEANVKQSASTMTNPEHIDTEHTAQSTTVELTSGGQRPEPLTPADARCAAHQGVPDPGPCRGCMTARKHAERAADAAAEAAAAERRDCPNCDENGWQLDPATSTPVRRCDHRRAS